MSFSGTVSATAFNANRVVDHAFRRCRLPAQAITAEMQGYALDALYLLLSEMANVKPPSWCIERIVLPFYENQPDVPLPIGTVEVLNANYRVLQLLSGVETFDANTYVVEFEDPTIVSTVGVKWSAAAVPVVFEVSDDGVVWTAVGSSSVSAVAGEITWTDITAALAHQRFRVRSTSPMSYAWITLGNMPQEIPFGVLNRDTYVAQSNKIFPGRPNSYWFQRDIPEPMMHIWPAPFGAAEKAQLVVWRHRHIMDVATLQQDVEVPQRWIEAITAKLAARVAAETPQVDAALIPALEQRAAGAEMLAWQGDNDGSPTFIQPAIGCYTK